MRLKRHGLVVLNCNLGTGTGYNKAILVTPTKAEINLFNIPTTCITLALTLSWSE